MASFKKSDREAHRRTILSMLETTPATVGRPPGHSEAAEPIPDIDFDWRPHPLERVVAARRTYRWPIVVGAVLAGVALLAGARYGLAVPAQQATVRQDEYRVGIDDFAAALDRLDGAPTVADPAAAADFAAATQTLRALAETPLPWALPLVPLGPDLAPVRAKLLEVTDGAVALSATASHAARYRDAADHILSLPPLPFSAGPELIDPAAKALANMQAVSTTARAALDDDPAYEPYRTRVTAALAALPDWIDRYLLALRRGNTQLATELVAELERQRALAEADLAAVFAEVDIDAESAIAALRVGVDAVRILNG